MSHSFDSGGKIKLSKSARDTILKSFRAGSEDIDGRQDKNINEEIMLYDDQQPIFSEEEYLRRGKNQDKIDKMT